MLRSTEKEGRDKRTTPNGGRFPHKQAYDSKSRIGDLDPKGAVWWSATGFDTRGVLIQLHYRLLQGCSSRCRAVPHKWGANHGRVRELDEQNIPGLVQVPREPHNPATHMPLWQEEKLQTVNYVDDNTLHEKNNMENAEVDKETGDRIKDAPRTQNTFRTIVHRAGEADMQINPQKTTMICISDAATYTARAFILDQNGEQIDSVDTLKVLGFHFSSKPNMQAQLDAIVSKITQKLWSIMYLGHRGFNEQELLQVYCTVILPSQDYCSTVYHYSLTQAQINTLERIQARALKAIYGFEYLYSELLQWTGLDRLEVRRDKRARNFARNCIMGRLSHWFPLHEAQRETRRPIKYQESFARCSRLRNSPLFSLRQALNQEESGA